MSNLSARTGRDHQRYDNNFRLVSGYLNSFHHFLTSPFTFMSLTFISFLI
jgi:hypothetical protein